MINILISLSLALFSFEMFSITSKVSSLNKTMLNIPMSIFSFSIPIMMGGNYFFIKSTLEKKLDDYFASNVTKLVKEYTVKYSYYDNDYQGICMSDFCDAVKVSLDAQIDGLYKYHRAMKYYLGVGNG